MSNQVKKRVYNTKRKLVRDWAAKGVRDSLKKMNDDRRINKNNERVRLVQEVYNLVSLDCPDEELKKAVDVVIEQNKDSIVLSKKETPNPSVSLYNWCKSGLRFQVKTKPIERNKDDDEGR